MRRDDPDDVILRGPMDEFIPDVSITVLGIVFTTNAATEYEDVNDNPLANADAFDALAEFGDIVKIRDDLAGAGTPNGVADDVDLEED